MKPRFLHTILALVLCAVANLFSNVDAYGQTVKKVIEMEYWAGYWGSDNNLYAWIGGSSKPVAMPLPGGQTVKAAYGAFNLIRAVSNTGQLYNSSQYNQPSNTWVAVPTDSSGAALNDVINVWSYQDSYIIERADSSLWAGGIDYHQLFHTTGSIYMRPIQLSPAGLKFTKVVMGTCYVVGLTSSGVVYRWNYGQGNTTPTMMPTPRPAIDISTGNFNSILCIVQEASGDPTVGNIYAYGSAWGTWGATTAANYGSFTDISSVWTAGPWKRISQDWNTMHAINSSGALYGAGYNAQGEVGNGQEFINRYTYPNWRHYGWDFQDYEDPVAPTLIAPGVSFSDIYDNGFFTFYKYAMDVNGNLYSWGRGKTMVLGNGNFAGDAFNASDPNLLDVTVPTLVTPLATSGVTWAPTLPVAGAGANQTITTSSTTIGASGHPVWLVRGTDTLCCSFTGFQWTQESGPSTATIVSPTSKSTVVNNLQNGTYIFHLMTTDSHNGLDTACVQIVVNIGGNAPTVSAGSNVTITLPTSTATLTGTATGNGGNTISSYSWSQVSGPSTATTFGSAGAASTTVNGLVAGTYVFQLTATDNTGSSSSATVQVIVITPGPPSANAGSNQTITLPTNSVTLSGSGSETNGSMASYAWTQVSGPSTATLGSAGSASTSASGLVQGTYVFKLTVTDLLGITASATVQVVVNPAVVPGPPSANAGSNQTITLPTNSVTLSGSGSETNGSIVSYAWTQVSGPSTATTFGSAGSASTSANSLVAGTYVFKLTVTDAVGVSASATVQVTVNPAPAPGTPSANAGSDQTITLPTSSVTLSGSGSETNGSIVSYAWTQVSGPSTATTFGSAGSASTSANGLVAGTYVFKLTVTDALGVSASATVQVTVNAAPAPGTPSANAGSDQTITLPTNSVTLSGSGSETGGSIASYAWTLVSGPSTATFGNAGMASTSANGLVQGTYIFKLTVTDALGVTASATVQVTVNPPVPGPPSANAGSDQTITLPTNSVTLSGSGSETNGSIVSYVWFMVSGPSPVTFGSAGAASTTVSGLEQGTYTFQLTVKDALGVTATATVQVVVNGRKPPVANAGPDQTTSQTTGVQLNGTASYDPSGTIVDWSWTQVSGLGGVTIVGATSATPTLIGLRPGVYVFQLTVTDDAGLTASATVTITVTSSSSGGSTDSTSNPAVVAVVSGDTTVAYPQGDTAILNGSASYATGSSIASYSWVEQSGPTGVAITNDNGAVGIVGGMQPGDYVFRLTVTNAAGDTSSATMSVHVMDNERHSGVSQASLYPNPVSMGQQVTITGSSDYTGTVKFVIMDLSGHVMQTIEMAKEATTFTQTFGTSGLSRGVYVVLVELASNQKPYAMKFVVQ